MIRLITLSLIGLFIISKAYSQCEPDTAYTVPGIYPDSASGFPPAFATYEYNLVVTTVIPVDTVFFPPNALKVDSIGIVLFSGLPEGFEAIPNRPSGYWHGGTSGCMLITGTPSQDQLGNYPLEITVAGYLENIPIPFLYKITFYSITILDSIAFGITNLTGNASSRLKAYPNPFSDYIKIEFYADQPGVYDCMIYDARNRLLISESITVRTGKNSFKIDGSNLSKGIYFCVIRHKQQNFSSVIKLVKY